MIIIPSFKEFKSKAKKGNVIPVYTEIHADMETPVSAFKKLEGKVSFLLESVEGGEVFARYSFLGTEPSVIFRSKGREIELIKNARSEKFHAQKDSLLVLKDLMSGYKIVKSSKLPPFVGGAVGYMSYDMVRDFEKIPDNKFDELNLPDAVFMITDTIVIFDHVRHTLMVVSNVLTDGKDLKASYKEAIRKINGLVKKLNTTVKTSIKELKIGDLRSNTSKKEYEDMVRKAKKYIKSGDIIQTVLSQRMSAKIDSDPFDIYRALRIVNPAPYMYYLKFDNFKIIGASPEIMVRVQDGIVSERPIAGTRKRGKDQEEDEKLVKDLLSDPKEKAEHIMLVDLARNDIGRVCDFKSVNVNELMSVEKYSYVMHIVSNVQGKLRKDKDIYDVIRACFPAGTVSGAPKVRAMEIIEELEKAKRGPYAGLIGYFSYSGNLDSCITIKAHFH